MSFDKNSTGLTAFPEIPEDTEELLLYANKIKKVPPSIGALKKLVRAWGDPRNACPAR